MLKKIKEAMFKAEAKMLVAMNNLKNSERGDTNFISILIILGVVILVATVFIGFKDKIVGQAEQIVNDFTIG